jgi:hypothetical protein
VFMGESEFSKFEGEDLGRKLGKMSVGWIMSTLNRKMCVW